MTMKNGLAPKCLKLWYGTSRTDPRLIYTKDGLNVNYSNQYLIFGRGIYFTDDTRYIQNYRYEVPGQQNQYEVLCANVIIGKEIAMPRDNYTSQFLEPPAIAGTNDRYDSVKGNNGCGDDVFIVYKNVKTYPGLLVRYQL